MLEHVNLDKVLFLDIETVPQFPSYAELPDEDKVLWNHKSQFIKRGEFEGEVETYSRAGIYAEFGRIVCISVGWFAYVDGKPSFIVKSYSGHNEMELLSGFTKFVKENFNKSSNLLCAHNGKEFDFPYLCRRMLINRISSPTILNIAGKKPWEIQHLDTMDLWRFGDYKSYTPLNLLAHILNVPNPKDDMTGSEVHSVYWRDNDIERISKYCEKDVITIARILLVFKGYHTLRDNQILHM